MLRGRLAPSRLLGRRCVLSLSPASPSSIPGNLTNNSERLLPLPPSFPLDLVFVVARVVHDRSFSSSSRSLRLSLFQAPARGRRREKRGPPWFGARQPERNRLASHSGRFFPFAPVFSGPVATELFVPSPPQLRPFPARTHREESASQQPWTCKIDAFATAGKRMSPRVPGVLLNRREKCVMSVETERRAGCVCLSSLPSRCP